MRAKLPDERSHGTLMAVIRIHILTGEPVGSRAISRLRKESLSPASIRNIMMDLEEEGYLEQPHTSAGRVPTEKAYRYYASQCDANQPPSRTDESLIVSQLADFQRLPEEALLEKTSHVLSLVSNNLGVVVRDSNCQVVLERIHFVGLGGRRVLVVMVSPTAPVRHHVIRVDREIAQLDLETAANYLNVHFRGWELDRIREELVRRLAEERAAYDQILKNLEQLHARGMLTSNMSAEVFVEGASNLIGRPELAEPVRIRELLRAFEEKETIIRLLSQCIQNSGEPLQIVIGLPGKPSLLKNFALIGTTFSWQDRAAGRLAILGPARMQYDRVIRAVSYIGRLFQQQEMN
ncbi:MAG: heat-inducible transcription repressor HrcA [Acidobacteria bacterium]|nr:heat-inducible transcription repressor HrcA [Acidobacteriota bacterium]